MAAGTDTPTLFNPDPAKPTRHLQLVFSAHDRARDTRIRDVLALPEAARDLRRAALAHGLASGSPVNADALSVILAAKVINHPAPLTQFTEEMVWQLVWVDVFTWCANRRVAIPDAVPETLWALLDYLIATGGLHPGSESLVQLRGPLLSSAGLDRDGGPRCPAGRRRR